MSECQLLVILFIAYYAGGYVAGRMARFDGAKQGIAVWLWALVIAIVVAVVLAVAGSEYNVLSQLNSLPRVPISEGHLATGGIITAELPRTSLRRSSDHRSGSAVPAASAATHSSSAGHAAAHCGDTIS